MCRHAPPDPADWIHPTPATIDTPYASQASRALTVSVWIVFAYVRLHARVVVDVCVPPVRDEPFIGWVKGAKKLGHMLCVCVRWRGLEVMLCAPPRVLVVALLPALQRRARVHRSRTRPSVVSPSLASVRLMPQRGTCGERSCCSEAAFLPSNACFVRGPTTSRACGTSRLNLTLKVATTGDRFVLRFCTGKI